LYRAYPTFLRCQKTQPFFSRRKEESAKLLTELINSTDTLITPYTIPILRCILSRAREKNTIEVGSALMRCLCALAVVGGEHISGFTSEIMALVVRTLSDPLAVRQRQAALETLGAVCSATGYLVDPEFEHPKLVELITKVLTGEKNKETRREAMRVCVFYQDGKCSDWASLGTWDYWGGRPV
jgi:FKBP12-rapamycin complex-associated protein